MTIKMASNERLNVNVTTTLIELVLATVKMIGEEGERVLKSARGSYAPYRIWNRTGASICVWNDVDGDIDAKQIPHGKTIDWRFDDWKTMREVSRGLYTIPWLCLTVISCPTPPACLV